MIGKLALVAALAGSAIGAAAVLADDRAPAPVPAVAAAGTPAEPTPPPVDARDVRVILRSPDPKGGLGWAVRRFDQTLRNGTVVACYELGREGSDRFGWVGLDGVFRAARAGRSETPSLCRDAQVERAIGVSMQRFATLTQPENGSPQPSEAVTFGIAAPTVARVLPADEPPLKPGADGIVLRIVTEEIPPGSLTGVTEYRDGHRVTFNHNDLPPGRRERPLFGTESVAVRAPDPAGGEPWALIATRGDRGGVCLTYPGRLVGTRLGMIDRRLGVFHTTFLMDIALCPDPKRKPTRAFPMRLETSSSSIGGDDPRGRIERRVLENRTVISGRVYEDVATVTIRTPRDVRTLVPAGRAHAIIAVYDGGFPTGKVTATARFKDGKEVTRSVYTG
jgi:hypothetical protein